MEIVETGTYGEDPDLAVLIAEDEPAKPFARLLGATLPVDDGHVLAPANDAERVDVFGEVARQLAVGELVARDDLVHGQRH